ncbi:MAG TPA: hypothetical protein VKA37_09545 [Halobacteriales archaeon]|nr:hypothetical protein [Halobacteriales archaeon]
MADTRLSPDLDLEGLSPDEAFAVLGNEIRLDVVRVLWQADAAYEYDDGSDAVETLPYSELRRRVGVEDNGKFNYHLSKLEPHFVRRTDDGYRLSGAGKGIARTVIAVSGEDHAAFSADLGEDCPLCGGDVRVTYADQWLRVRCEECAGLFGDDAPTGTLFLTDFPAAGMSSRRPEDALETGLYRCALDITYSLFGVCRECAGPVSGSVSVCEEHDRSEGGPCATCGTPFPVWAETRCETCGFAKRLPVEMYVVGLVAVVGSFDVEAAGDLTRSLSDTIDLMRRRVETSVAEDPLRLSVAVDLGTATFEVTLDDEMTVVGFDRRVRARG